MDEVVQNITKYVYKWNLFNLLPKISMQFLAGYANIFQKLIF